MADDHRKLAALVKKLARDGKYLTIQVGDRAPDMHHQANAVAGLGGDDRPCKKWGYDPVTNQTICLER